VTACRGGHAAPEQQQALVATERVAQFRVPYTSSTRTCEWHEHGWLLGAKCTEPLHAYPCTCTNDLSHVTMDGLIVTEMYANLAVQEIRIIARQFIFKNVLLFVKNLIFKISFCKMYPSSSESKFGRYNRHRLLKKGPLSNFWREESRAFVVRKCV
jgi:hypothetical protein